MSDQGAAQGTTKPYAPGAIPSLVLGIIGTVFGACYAAGLIPSIIGLVFAMKARKALAANAAQYQSPGMATAGLVLSIIGLVASAIGIIIIIVAIVAVITATNSGASWMTP